MKKFLIPLILIMLVALSLTSCAKTESREAVKEIGFVKSELELELYKEKGKVVIIDFFTTWCSYCVRAIPQMKKMYEEIQAASANVQILAIDIAENKDKVKRFVEKYQLPYQVVIDEDQALARKYKVSGIPTYVVLDEKGDVLFRGNHLEDWKAFVK